MTKTKLFPVTLDKDGKVEAKVVYFGPKTEPDPDFNAEPVLVFTEKNLWRRVAVAEVLSNFGMRLRYEIVPLFEPLCA